MDLRDPLRAGRRLVIVSKTVLDASRWIVLAKRMQCKWENINGGEATPSHWLAISELLRSRDTCRSGSTGCSYSIWSHMGGSGLVKRHQNCGVDVLPV
jgi:hypothetical protein